MGKTYQVKVLSSKEFDRVARSDGRYRHVDEDNLGFADPVLKTAYVRDTAVDELNKYLINHEFEHLLEGHGTDEDDCGIRHKKAKDIFRNLAATAAAPFTGGLSLSAGTKKFRGEVGDIIPNEAKSALPTLSTDQPIGRTFRNAAPSMLGAALTLPFGGAGSLLSRGASMLGNVAKGGLSALGMGGGAAAGGAIPSAGLNAGLARQPLASMATRSAQMGAQQAGRTALQQGTARLSAAGVGGALPQAMQAAARPQPNPVLEATRQAQQGAQRGGLEALRAGTNTNLQATMPSMADFTNAAQLDPVRVNQPAGGGSPAGGGGGGTPPPVAPPQQSLSGAPQPVAPAAPPPPAPTSTNPLQQIGNFARQNPTLAGMGVSAIGDLFADEPEAPDFSSIESVNQLREAMRGANSPLGALGQQQLSARLSSNFQGLEPGMEQSIRNTFNRERQNLISQFKAIRPNADLTSDSAYRQALFELDARESDAIAQQQQQAFSQFNTDRTNDIAAALGVDTQTVNTLTQLAQQEIATIMIQLGVDAAEAQQFKQTWGNLGAAVATGAFNPQSQQTTSTGSP